jgi:hypothetical protein
LLRLTLLMMSLVKKKKKMFENPVDETYTITVVVVV